VSGLDIIEKRRGDQERKKGYNGVAKNIVIAVDISGEVDRTKLESTMKTIFQTFNIMYSKLGQIQLAHADVVIRPKVGNISSSDFSKRHEAILEGEKAAMEALPQITQIINRLKAEGRLETK
jgi:NTE family protein